MPEMEARYPCPVCLGVKMVKTPVGETGELVLDHCERCGGAWFEAGEVQRLRAARPEELWRAIAPREAEVRAQCHGCHAFLERNADHCPACGRNNVLECPACERAMQATAHSGVKLDVCPSCRGVWFDHPELAAVWRLELTQAVRRRQSAEGMDVGALVLLDALAYNPWLTFEAARLAGHAAHAAGHALGNAPEAVGVAVEAAGDAAAGIFETILEIISGLFE